jgi:hypothetical protein
MGRDGRDETPDLGVESSEFLKIRNLLKLLSSFLQRSLHFEQGFLERREISLIAFQTIWPSTR